MSRVHGSSRGLGLGLLEGSLQGLQRLADLLECALHALHLPLYLLRLLLQPLLSFLSSPLKTGPCKLMSCLLLLLLLLLLVVVWGCLHG